MQHHGVSHYHYTGVTFNPGTGYYAVALQCMKDKNKLKMKDGRLTSQSPKWSSIVAFWAQISDVLSSAVEWTDQYEAD